MSAARLAASADSEYAELCQQPPSGWTLKRGLLIDGTGRIQVPSDAALRTRIMAELHDSGTGAHV